MDCLRGAYISDRYGGQDFKAKLKLLGLGNLELYFMKSFTYEQKHWDYRALRFIELLQWSNDSKDMVNT
jgi:hypothetical protein